ncbi:SDR family oxidoreductase [Candidatus Pseudothioglobus singularis]|nr:SDR family oxidoreductase [Candidatus Pseudothioglobus singularis]
MILITGGTGYLGGRLASYLRKLNFEVRIGGRKASADSYGMDYSDDSSLEVSCKEISTIIHLACMNAQSCEKDPELSFVINSIGTLKLLKAAEKEGVSRFIYFSTAHVYCSPLIGEINEEFLTQPIHPYSISKKCAEDFVIEASINKRISGTIFRLTNAVGSPVNPEANCWMLVANDLCRQVVLNKHMELYSNEYTKRDFVPISSLCHVVYSALLSDNISSEIVNVSSGIGLTLRELTDLIVERSQKVLGFKPTVNFNDESVNDDQKNLIISNSKLNRLGIKVDVDLANEIDQILLNCTKWF